MLQPHTDDPAQALTPLNEDLVLQPTLLVAEQVMVLGALVEDHSHLAVAVLLLVLRNILRQRLV